jgi:hypothetical protein
VSLDRSRRQRLVRVERSSDWTVWARRDAGLPDDGNGGLLGEPGLWRWVRRNGGVDRIFDCPSFAMLERLAGAAAQDFDEAALRAETREWARATAAGAAPEGWAGPDPEEVGDWHAPDRFAVRAGPHLAKGELECDSTRLRLRFSELARLDASLPEARRAWARAVCLDTQSRWHLVRFGLDGERVCAEVDLSGVPAGLARPLFSLALEALAFTVAWALPALALIADANVTSRTLDREPWWLRENPRPHAPVNNASQPALAG